MASSLFSLFKNCRDPADFSKNKAVVTPAGEGKPVKGLQETF